MVTNKKLGLANVIGIRSGYHSVARSFHQTDKQVTAGVAIVIQDDVNADVTAAVHPASNTTL